MKLYVDLKEHGYPIYIERGILDQAAEKISEVYQGKKVMIISDDQVYSYYGEKLKTILSEKYECYECVIPHGEQSKSIHTLPGVYSELLKAKLSRTDLIVALGGGVVGDLAGFVAATYLRGIKFVQIPTSILAQVDSSVGGKTGVDTKYGKNLVGAFYQPKIVIIDPETLDTLSSHYFADGMGEVIKYGCIRSEELFSTLETCDINESIEDIIIECLKIKRDVVNEDERESGIRMILNFGHTAGHSIEKLSNFSLSHGECVAKGMVMITKASEKLGLSEKGTTARIENLCTKYSLNTDIPFDTFEIGENAKNDKKGSDNNLSVILTDKIGSCFIHTIDKNEFANFLK